MKRRLRMGMIGGGPGSFIGPIHRIAAEFDREIELVAGAFSSDPSRSRIAAEDYGIDPARAYADVATMLRLEPLRSDVIDFITIVSPNHHHFPAAKAALEAGIAVFSDKPMTSDIADAKALAAIVDVCGRPYALTYTYSGYSLVREARARVAAGELGDLRKVVVEYPQGWLAGPAESKQAQWRTDPARAGSGGCIADIGVHAFHLAEFVTGLRITEMLADLGTVVPGRTLDDDCSVLVRFENGARGVLLASQIETGELNGLRIRAYGSKGGLVWQQEQPNTLALHNIDGSTRLIRSGEPGLIGGAGARPRAPGGHPEGYLEAFANLYADFATVLRGGSAPLLPGIEDGLRGMEFIERAVSASRLCNGWVPLPALGDAA